MSAQKKSSGKNNAADSKLESNQNDELEKKVDEMMSVEELESLPEPSKEPETPEKVEVLEPEPVEVETPETPEVPEVPEPDPPASVETLAPENEPASAPLLPTEELPDLEKTKAPEDDKPTEPETPPVMSQPAADYRPTEVKPAQPEENLTDDLGLEDVGTSKAVDEIIASDADAILDKSDRETALKKEPTIVKSSSGGLKKILKSKAFRRAIFILLLLSILLAAIFPTSRYFALNTAGVRSASSVKVIDESTKQPLKNAVFSINGVSGKTNEEGDARIENLKLGSATLKISKPAFAEVSQPITLGWGSNPLGDFQMQAVGLQYKFKLFDFLSKKPITNAEALSGQASAMANEKGEVVLVVPVEGEKQVEVEVKADGYRTEKRTMDMDQKETTEIPLVPAKKQAFISKRAGTYDVYKVDVDGLNEEMVLPGNGSEQIETMSLSAHPTKNMAALISSRDNIRNKDGLNLGTLNLINLDDNSVTQVTQSERIQLLGWEGDRLVYQKVTEGSNADSKDRHKIISYDIEPAEEKELASSNYFNDILAANGYVYYAPAAFNVNGAVGLFKIKIDGSDKKTIYDKEVWNIIRSEYNKLKVSMAEEWYELNLASDELTKQDGPPAVRKTRLYYDGPGNNLSLWVDERDGKGTLLEYSKETKEDKIIQTQGGLKNPVRWLSGKHIIYRVTNNQETADYIMNREGGEARKIIDVTDTAGLDRWYFY